MNKLRQTELCTCCLKMQKKYITKEFSLIKMSACDCTFYLFSVFSFGNNSKLKTCLNNFKHWLNHFSLRWRSTKANIASSYVQPLKIECYIYLDLLGKAHTSETLITILKITMNAMLHSITFAHKKLTSYKFFALRGPVNHYGLIGFFSQTLLNAIV